MTNLSNTQLKLWRSQLTLARCEHQKPLRRQLRELEKGLQSSNNENTENKKKLDSQVEHFSNQLENSLTKTEHFKKLTPKIVFPDELPISQRRDEIAELIKNNQIIIVAGETGSGKTTQLPKICLELGYGTRGLIGHTQPRRIAARTVADRIASELNSPLGETVGYQVRFKDVSSKKTQVKLMTDGVLLAEIQGDRMLSRYEVIIIDEAHERSLNIDFLLGLLKPLCEKRKDLKVIITSATIDLEKFSQHFTLKNRPAPIIEVSGRTYPVEVEYQELDDKLQATDLPNIITQTVETLLLGEAKGRYKAKGDILVFCAGEREIRDIALALRRSSLQVDVLPLYSRLSVQEQNKVFQRSQQRKVVLATNVAETSITVPGIGYVIDPGMARISRYSFRSKVQRLPIEEISQASANQRMGRCGRMANGVCVRLYSEDNFKAREAFTSAEILRSNLASVILQMRRLHIRDIEHFDFIDRPDQRLLNDGIKLLQELNAVDDKQQLTAIGKQLSVIPVDPRYARILAAANDLDCLRDALVVISVLSIQDPRERPADHRQKADEKHRVLHHAQSDFYSYLNLWQSINDKRQELSNTQFKKYCLQNFWNIARVFEWRELYRQLATVCKDLGWTVKEWKTIELPDASVIKKQQKDKPKTDSSFDTRYENLHKALLSGLLSNIATKDLNGEYQATRQRKTTIYPGSSQAKRKPKWLVAAEFLETSRLFSLTVAEINPDWLIALSGHLCKYNYSDPHYHARSGQVKAYRKTLLFGLTLRDKDAVNYATINPKEARQLFIQRGLVEGMYQYRSQKKQKSFTQHNHKVIRDIKKLETKTRRRDLLVNEQNIYDFYARSIPVNVACRATFEKWYSKQIENNPKLLMLNQKTLLATNYAQDEVAQFPESILVNGKKIKLFYTFDPSSKDDGVCMQIPLSLLAPFPEHLGSWLVPGLLKEKCITLLKTLPKALRKNFIPAAEAIAEVLPTLVPSAKDLSLALGEQLFKQRGVRIPSEAWDLDKLDNYYLMNYRVIDDKGGHVAQGKDLQAIKQQCVNLVQESVQADKVPEREAFERNNLCEWDFGDLPKTLSYQHQGMQVTAYPMLKVMQDESISLQMSYTPELADYFTSRGLIKLTQIHLSNKSQSYKYLHKELFKTKTKKSNTSNTFGDLGSLANQLKSVKTKVSGYENTNEVNWKNEVIDAALWQSCFAELKELPHDQNSYENALLDAKQWVSNALTLETAVSKALENRANILARIKSFKSASKEADKAILDIKSQLKQLFDPTCLRYTNFAQIKQYPRYCKAIETRLDKLNQNSFSTKDMNELYSVQVEFDELVKTQCQAINSTLVNNEQVAIDALFFIKPGYYEYFIMLQEWRVSLFAQQLRTAFPISIKRLQKAASKLLE